MPHVTPDIDLPTPAYYSNSQPPIGEIDDWMVPQDGFMPVVAGITVPGFSSG
jgi:hypothetical protein